MPPFPPAEGPPDNRARAAAWSDYWAAGTLHSCGGSFSGNYGGAIAAFWRRVFGSLPADPRVLDLCCGNAPLSKLLIEDGHLGAGVIDAVDLAAVAPAWVDALPGSRRAQLRLHPRMDAASLPFEAGCFDLCMSQYGVEYIGAAAVAELARVLRSGGRLAAVIHHHESLPVRIAREELVHIDWLLDPGQGPLAAARPLAEPMARAATAAGQASLRGDAGANAARALFNARLGELQQRIASARYPDALQEAADAVLAALREARLAGADAGRAALEGLAAELQASRLRQHELVACALDADGVRALLAPLGDPEPGLEVLRFGSGDIAGWAVQARPAGAGGR